VSVITASKLDICPATALSLASSAVATATMRVIRLASVTSRRTGRASSAATARSMAMVTSAARIHLPSRAAVTGATVAETLLMVLVDGLLEVTQAALRPPTGLMRPLLPLAETLGPSLVVPLQAGRPYQLALCLPSNWWLATFDVLRTSRG
jgi:hypothetical protein